MKRQFSILAFALTALCLQAQPAYYLSIPNSAERLALGGYDNALPKLQGGEWLEAGFTKTLWQPKGVNYNISDIRAMVRPLSFLAAGLEFSSNNMAGYDGYDDRGNSMGSYQPYEMSARAEVRLYPFRSLTLSVAGRILHSSLGSNCDAQSLSADFGCSYTFAENVTVGVQCKNIGGALDYGGGSSLLPAIYSAGAYANISISQLLRLEGALSAGSVSSYSTPFATAGAGLVIKGAAVRLGGHFSGNAAVMPSYFSAGAFYAGRHFEIGGAYVTAANTFSFSAKLTL